MKFTFFPSTHFGLSHLLLPACLLIGSLLVPNVKAQNVGIGTTHPTAMLHVNGTFKLTDGTQGNGKIMVSDNTGKASWQTMTATATGDENVAGVGDWNPCQAPNLTAYQPISGTQSQGFMGRKVAITDSFAFVGISAFDTLSRTNTGIVAVYKLQNNAWVEVQRLVDDTGTNEAYFGWSLAASGQVLVVGAPSETVSGYFHAGSVSVFNYNGGSWSFKKKLKLSAPAPNDNFGWDVDIDGDYLVVGAPTYSGVGRAFVYYKNNGDWQYNSEMPNTYGSSGDAFAQDVAIAGNLVAIGAPFYDVDSTDCGSVFVYLRGPSGYVQTNHLYPDSYGFRRNHYAGFGNSVAMDGNTLVVGIPNFKSYYSVVGGIALYQFNGTNMELLSSYRSDSNTPGDSFGGDVSISGPYCLVSASGSRPLGPTSYGSYRLYKRQGGALYKIAEIVDPVTDGVNSHLYGDIHGSTGRFVLGSPYTNNTVGAIVFGKSKI